MPYQMLIGAVGKGSMSRSRHQTITALMGEIRCSAVEDLSDADFVPSTPLQSQRLGNILGDGSSD